jgi:hypothetical protein
MANSIFIMPAAAPRRACFRPRSLVQEVVMTVSEYEERFQPPASSVHQAFIDMHSPKWTRRRRRRFWIAVALLGLITATTVSASHPSAYADPGHESRHCRLISDGPRIEA